MYSSSTCSRQVASTWQIHCLLPGSTKPRPCIEVKPSNDLAGGRGFPLQHCPATLMIQEPISRPSSIYSHVREPSKAPDVGICITYFASEAMSFYTSFAAGFVAAVTVCISILEQIDNNHQTMISRETRTDFINYWTIFRYGHLHSVSYSSLLDPSKSPRSPTLLE